MKYTVYAAPTGKILRYGECPEDLVQLQAIGPIEQVISIDCDSDITQYIQDGEVVSRPDPLVIINNSNTSADGVTPCVLSNIPSGSVAKVGGNTVGVIYDGVLELTFDEPGDYIVHLELFPYLDTEFTINAI